MELILNSFEPGKSITWRIGRGGAWKSRLFLGQMTLASLVAISGRKKVSISRAHPLQMPLLMDLARLKTITYHAI
jgi:hypothetical protein